MSPSELERIEEAFKRSGCEWILKYPQDDRERQIFFTAVAKEIGEFQGEYRRRFGKSPDPFGLLNENQEKATAFFEIFSGPPLSVDVLVLIWRLIEGAEIRDLVIQYQRKKAFSGRFVVGERGGADEVYETTTPWDFTVVRHFGMLTVNNNLILDGYYASTSLGP